MVECCLMNYPKWFMKCLERVQPALEFIDTMTLAVQSRIPLLQLLQVQPMFKEQLMVMASELEMQI